MNWTDSRIIKLRTDPQYIYADSGKKNIEEIISDFRNAFLKTYGFVVLQIDSYYNDTKYDHNNSTANDIIKN